MDSEALWKNFWESHDDYWRNKLVEHYFPVVRCVAGQVFTKISGQVDFDDLFSTGILGLLKAVEAFDPNRGYKFETYCNYRIRGEILDSIRNMDWIPRGVRSEKIDVPGFVSLDDALVDSRSPNPVYECERNEVFRFLSILSERELAVVKYYYFKGMSMRETGRRVGITGWGAALILKRILTRLKKVAGVAQ